MNKKELQFKRNEYAFCLKRLTTARQRMAKAKKEVEKYYEQAIKLETELRPYRDVEIGLQELLTV